MTQITNTDGSRWYNWPSADRTKTHRHWSVTTIIDRGVPKPALKWWAAKATAEWCVDNMETLATILTAPVVESYRPIPLERLEELANEEGLVDPQKLALLVQLARSVEFEAEAINAARDEAVDLAKGSHRRTTKRAALKGSHVHKAIEAYHLRKPYPGVPEVVQGQYDEFLRFLADHRPIVEQTEASVYNREWFYAGTLDAIMLFPTLAELLQEAGLFEPTEEQPWPRLIVDVKTSGSGVYPEVGLQMSAYKHAEFIAGPDGSEHPMPEIHGAAVLWLPADGEYELRPVGIGDEVFRSFLYAYEILRWDETISKGVLAPAVPSPVLDDPAAEFERLSALAYEELEKIALLRGHVVASGLSAEELACGIVWAREEVRRGEQLAYQPEHPCPACGWEVEKVVHRNGKTPKWRCTNDGCGGGKDGRSWASWETNPWQKPGQTAHLQPRVAKAERAKAKTAAPAEEPQQTQLTVLEGGASE